MPPSLKLPCAIDAACPVLEYLHVRHGVMWTGGSNPRSAQPLPVASSCFSTLPSTIQTLHLEQITVTLGAFEGAILPNLKRVTLKQCGQFAEGVTTTLCSIGGPCPMLSREKAIVIGGGPSRR